MKVNEIINERIKRLELEKEMWLNKMNYNEEGYERKCFNNCIERINELLDLLDEINLKGESNE